MAEEKQTPTIFQVQVIALDSGHGYALQGVSSVMGTPAIQINEHYGTDEEIATRLASGLKLWAEAIKSEK
jgi:hypothetical protein